MTFRSVFSGFFFTLFFVVQISAAYAQDETAKVCQDLKSGQTKINVNYQDIPVAYELGKSARKISTDFMTTYKAALAKSGMDIIWGADDLKIGGLSMAAFAVSVDSRLRSDRVDSMGAYNCPYFDEIDIDVFYAATIAISDDYPKDSCKFKVLNKHELTHVQSNKSMVDQYIIGLEGSVRKMLPHIEGGYVGSDKVKGRINAMKGELGTTIVSYLTESIRKDSASINAQIDVPAEYQNLDKLFNLCDVRDAYYRKQAQEEQKKK